MVEEVGEENSVRHVDADRDLYLEGIRATCDTFQEGADCDGVEHDTENHLRQLEQGDALVHYFGDWNVSVGSYCVVGVHDHVYNEVHVTEPEP